MFKTNVSGHNKLWGAQSLGTPPLNAPMPP